MSNRTVEIMRNSIEKEWELLSNAVELNQEEGDYSLFYSLKSFLAIKNDNSKYKMFELVKYPDELDSEERQEVLFYNTGHYIDEEPTITEMFLHGEFIKPTI